MFLDTPKLDLFYLFYNLLQTLAKWAQLIYDFLFKEITFGFKIEILNIDKTITFIPFWAFGGVIAITLLTMYLVKTFIPVA